MSVTFVTAFFGQQTMFRPVDTYFSLFNELASTGIQIVLFLDSQFKHRGIEICSRFPNVTIPEYVTLDTSVLSDTIVLPEARNVVKDTAEYMCIQLEKLHMLTKASAYTSRPFLAWIDFGIFRIFQDKEACAHILRSIETSMYNTEAIYAPGCWDTGNYNIWNAICWRFCGGFLLGHRDLFKPAYEEQLRLVITNLPRLTWEVNYWTLMNHRFQWYFANHDDTIVTHLPAKVNI